MADPDDKKPVIEAKGVDIAQQVEACFIDEQSSMEDWGKAHPLTKGRAATGRNDLPQDRNILK